MTNSGPNGLIDRIVGAATSLLVAALALYIAAKLVAAVWVVLVACFMVAVAISWAVLAMRNRSNGGW